jgi:predicted TIM-barrel fold metal-dependent hydrolase
MGRMDTSHGTSHSGFVELCRLVEKGQAWVKISGADRIRSSPQTYEDVDSFARALINANIERVVWGTDWPHINYFDQQAMPDDGDLTNLLMRWLPSEKDRIQVLVKNPESLYDF